MSYDTDQNSLGSIVNNEELASRQYVYNHAFYMVVPEPYRQYYLRFVRPYFWWYDGYVPFFHTTTTGIMPTNLARVLVRKLANLTTGSKLLFDDEDTNVMFFERSFSKVTNDETGEEIKDYSKLFQIIPEKE